MLHDYVEQMYLPAGEAARDEAAAVAEQAAEQRAATRAAIVANQGG
jgi:hypothetical protein